MKRSIRSFVPAGLALCLAGAFALSPGTVRSQEPDATAKTGAAKEDANPWTDEDTQLANQYVRLLEARPEYGNVLDLMWNHYASHHAVDLLLSHYKAAAEASGATPQARLVYAHLLRKNDQLPLARLRYQQVVTEKAVRPLALLGLADVARERLDAQECERYLNELLEEESVPGEVLRRSMESLADFYLEQSDTASALGVWRQLIERFPEDLGMLQELAGRMIGSGHFDEAIEVYKKLLGHPDPEKRIAALVELGRLYEISDDFEGAAAALNQGRDATHFKHYTHLEFLSLLVRLYERQGRLEELEAVFVEEAGRTRPTEKALFSVVRFYELTAEPTKRQKWLRKLTKAVPGIAEYRRELVEVLLSNDHYSEAKRVLEEFLAGGVEETLSLRLLRVKIELSLAGRETGSALLSDFLARRTLSGQERSEVLGFAEANYLDEIAEKLLREELGGDSEEAVFRLANLHFSRGRIAEALAEIERHLARAGDEPVQRAERLLKAAAALQGMELREAAIEALEEAVALQPEELKYVIRLAEIQSDAMNIDEAVERYEIAWQLCKSSDDRLDIDQRIFSLLQLADLQPDLAEKEWEGEAVPFSNPAQSNDLSRFLRMQVDPSGAIERRDGGGRLYAYYAALRADALEGGAPDVLLRAAWWAHRMGDNPAAFKLLIAFREAKPNHLRAERLLLEVAVSSGDDMLALRQLDLLTKIDGERSMEYALRGAQIRLRQGESENQEAALQDLAGIASDETTAANVLANLARVYERLGRITEAKRIYRRAFEKSSLHEKRKLLVELTRLQVEQGAIDEALDTITDLVREEHDILHRRKQLRNQVNFAMRHQRLGKLQSDYEAIQRKQPLDPFYSEALALIYENAGKARAAFFAIKKAYYSARKKDAHLLERMRHLAAKTEDVDAAIYYQRQLVSVPDNRAEPTEWHKLIRMLELDFQVHEADRIRLRLESKFAQDPDVLRELTRYYLDARQPAAARRVLGRMVRLRPWDVTAHLSLGILEKESGNDAEAAEHFLQVLAHTQEAADQSKPAPDSGIDHFPLRGFSRESRPEMMNRTRALEHLVQVIDDVRVIDNRLRVQVAHYLESGRAEFLAVPDQPDMQRLRAIEELGELVVAPAADGQLKAKWDAHWRSHQPRAGEEEFWVAWCGGDWLRAWDILQPALAEAPGGPEELFFCLYAARMGRMPQLMDWIRDSGEVTGARDRRLGWMVAVISLLALDPETRIAEEQLVAFFESSLVIPAHTYTLLKLLNTAGQVHEALRIGEIAKAHGRVVRGYFDADLASLAGTAGDVEKQGAYLEVAIDTVNPLASQFQDAIANAYAIQNTDDQRAALIARALARFEEVPENPRAVFGRAWFLAMAGKKDLAAEACRQLVSLHLDQAKRVGESLTGTFINENSQWMSLFDYANGARRLGFSDIAREPFSNALDQYDLIAPRLDETAGQFQQFQSFFFHQLLWEFEDMPHVERMARIRSHGSLFRGSDDRESLARTLSGEEFHREAALIYRDLLYANPLSNEFARAFLTASEKARADEDAIAYIDLLLNEQLEEPEGANKIERIRLHAKFLRMGWNVDRLKVMAEAQRGMAPQLAPEDLHYHRELAALLVEAEQLEDAARVYAEIDDGKHVSVSLLRSHARVLSDLENKEAAIHLLERIELGRQSLAIDRPIIEDLSPLYADTGAGDKLRGLATRALDHGDEDLVIVAAEELSRVEGLEGEAESLLLLAMRRATTDVARLQLVIPAIDLATKAESPERLSPLLETFFSCELSESRPAQREFIAKIRAAAGGPMETVVRAFLNEAATAERAPGFANVCRLEFALASDDAAAPLGKIVERLVDPHTHFEELAMAVESCLEHDVPGLAQPILTALEHRRPRIFDHAALAFRLHGARGDQAAMASLFNRVLSQARRTPYLPGATKTALGEALVASGEPERAARLYRSFYEQIGSPGSVHRDFVEHYARFLMERGDFLAAENVLRGAFRKSADYDPGLIVDLYAKRDRPEELGGAGVKFDLSSGLRKRVEFLALRLEAGQDNPVGDEIPRR